MGGSSKDARTMVSSIEFYLELFDAGKISSDEFVEALRDNVEIFRALERVFR